MLRYHSSESGKSKIKFSSFLATIQISLKLGKKRDGSFLLFNSEKLRQREVIGNGGGGYSINFWWCGLRGCQGGCSFEGLRTIIKRGFLPRVKVNINFFHF